MAAIPGVCCTFFLQGWQKDATLQTLLLCNSVMADDAPFLKQFQPWDSSR
jgi:hypothetical protein